jgi:hypothetical protein
MSSTSHEQQPSLWTNESLPLARRKELLAEEVRRFKQDAPVAAANEDAAEGPTKPAPESQAPA